MNVCNGKIQRFHDMNLRECEHKFVDWLHSVSYKKCMCSDKTLATLWMNVQILKVVKLFILLFKFVLFFFGIQEKSWRFESWRNVGWSVNNRKLCCKKLCFRNKRRRKYRYKILPSFCGSQHNICDVPFCGLNASICLRP